MAYEVVDVHTDAAVRDLDASVDSAFEHAVSRDADA
jgi:hypothetical protein